MKGRNVRHIAHWINKVPFLFSEDGAVTVDWVVLTAAIVGLGIAVMAPIAFATDGSATSIGNYINNVQIGFGSN